MSAARDKGTRAETAVVNFLRHQLSPWLPEVAAGIGRHPLHGAADVGDIRGVPQTVIQVKNTRRIDLAGAVDAARAQAARADAEMYAAWIKRRGVGTPGDWYVVMDGDRFVDLLLPYLGAEVPPLGGANR